MGIPVSQHAHINEHKHTHTHLHMHKTDWATPQKSHPHICIVTLKTLQQSRKEHQSAEDEAQSMNVEWQTPSLFSSNACNQSLSLFMEITLTWSMFLIQCNWTRKCNQLVKGCQKQLCRISASVFTIPVLFLLILHTGNDYLSQKQSPKQKHKNQLLAFVSTRSKVSKTSYQPSSTSLPTSRLK